MIVGTAYYPEHWTKDRLETDAGLMKEMGINTVRMGEFGWAIMEPEEGRYDFSFYENCINILGNYGIKTIFCTPTAAPPKWLCDKFPGIYREAGNEGRPGFGGRRNYCYNNREYRAYSRKIVEKELELFGKHPHIIGWQIDNELGCEDEVRCYCEDCRQAFINWLQDKYHTLDQLNEHWGTIFWSQVYTNWEQIIVPKATVLDSYSRYVHNPGLLLDYARFSSDSLIHYAKEQCEIIREFTKLPVIHNMVSEYCDNYKFGNILDYAGYDAYPRSEWDCHTPAQIAFHYDLTKGYKENPFWVLEQQSGPCGWNAPGETPEPGQLRLWSLQGAAHGAMAMVYFRWRSCLFGTEQYWYGILDHDGIPRRRYFELKQAAADMLHYEEFMQMEPKKEVLLVYDYDNKFSHEFQRHHPDFDYKKELMAYYEGLWNNRYSVTIAGKHAGFRDYPIVFMPYFSLLDESCYAACKEYVYHGGVLVLSMLCGFRECNNQITQEPLPGRFSELAGIEVEEFDTLYNRKVQAGDIGRARMRCEVLKPVQARSLTEYQNHYYKGRSAVTVNTYGKGSVYYIGCDLEDYTKLVKMIGMREHLPSINLPDNVECIQKQSDNDTYFILLNHSPGEQSIQLPGFHKVHTNIRDDFHLAGYDLLILKSEKTPVSIGGE